MTEEEFYKLKHLDHVYIFGQLYQYKENMYLDPYNKLFERCESPFIYYFVNQHDDKVKYYINCMYMYDINFNEFLVGLSKKNSTIDEKISETKSEIEKLQNQLKKLESEKNSKKIEQLISEMVPGKFYTIEYENIYYPIGKTTTGKLEQKTRETIRLSLNSSGVQIMIASIKDIIPREDLTNDYNKFMEKIKKYNQGEI